MALTHITKRLSIRNMCEKASEFSLEVLDKSFVSFTVSIQGVDLIDEITYSSNMRI